MPKQYKVVDSILFSMGYNSSLHAHRIHTDSGVCYTDVKDSEGQSPLDRALEFLYEYDDCVYVALYLMNRGCGGDEDIKDDLLYAACCKGKLELVKELIEQHEVNPMCKSECMS